MTKVFEVTLVKRIDSDSDVQHSFEHHHQVWEVTEENNK